MSVDTYKCSHCGAQFGITGPGEGTDEDYAAEEYYQSEVEYHETHCQRAERIAGLRALADLLESTPDLPLPELTGNSARWDVWPTTAEDVPAELARIVRLLPGPLTKNDPADGAYAAKYYELTGKLRGLKISASAYRETVCERVEVGTREVVEDEPIIAGYRKVPKVVTEYEWQCKPLLAEATS